jgi:serine protease Do
MQAMRNVPLHCMKGIAMKLRSIASAAAAASLGLVVVGASALSLPEWMSSHPATPKAAPSTAITPNVDAVPMVDAQGQVPDYRTIVKRFGPAVVGVTVSGMHKASAEEEGASMPDNADPFFQFFRGMPGFQGRGAMGSPKTPFRGQGSGFIVSADGLIMTNAHVVRDAKEVTVHLADRREFAAKVLGSDPVTDVAVLRIDAKGLPTVRLGDASKVEVGDRVLAIGAPYGLEQTATQGIVSAKGRSLPGDSVVPFLQTDAAVNPGNSGGPLFEGHGEVVGINAQIYTQSGGFQGLSFAIPIDVALKVKDQIVATGKATHARLGVTVQDLTAPLAESFGLPSPDGALVSQVAPGSAAAREGLKPGDVITQVNEQPVVRSGQLSSLIGMARPGDKAHLKVWRDHGWKDMEVRLGGQGDSNDTVASAGDASADGGQIGLAVRPLTRGELREAELNQGLLVQDVSGPAQRAGVEAGDVLLAVNGQPVQSVETLRKALRAQPKTLALLLMRDHQQIFVPVRLS